MSNPLPLLTVKLKLHGITYETRHDADAVMASDWASDNKGIMRMGESDARDAAQLERESNIGEARRLANAAAATALRRVNPDLRPWENLSVNAKVALRFIRKVR